LVLDNSATHKGTTGQSLARRTLALSSCIPRPPAPPAQRVECWFALLADKQIKRGVLRSVHELEAAITAFIQAQNDEPKPFVWTKSADAILQTIARYCSGSLAVHAKTHSTKL
jgi:hypothetical protein